MSEISKCNCKRKQDFLGDVRYQRVCDKCQPSKEEEVRVHCCIGSECGICYPAPPKPDNSNNQDLELDWEGKWIRNLLETCKASSDSETRLRSDMVIRFIQRLLISTIEEEQYKCFKIVQEERKKCIQRFESEHHKHCGKLDNEKDLFEIIKAKILNPNNQ